MQKLTEYTPNVQIQLCGRQWHLERAADLETLWEAMCDDEGCSDERLPYWTELWPSSLVLAEWLHHNKAMIAGKRCLDIGCGLGLTALVASWLGGDVIAMDYEPEALYFANRNAIHNNVPSPLWVLMDWRFPAVLAQSCDIIWGGDIMYETRFVDPVLTFLEHSLAPDGRVWVAEPNRNVYKHFRSSLLQRGWKYTKVTTEKIDALYEQNVPVTVNLWELCR